MAGADTEAREDIEVAPNPEVVHSSPPNSNQFLT